MEQSRADSINRLLLVLNGGPQGAGDHDVVEACEPPARRRPTPDRSRIPDGGLQSASDEVVEASEPPAVGPRAAARHQRVSDEQRVPVSML